MHSVRVWDLPLRAFHWLLVLGVVGMVVTAQLGRMDWHFRCGYALLTLLLFRFVWGLVGGYWARFLTFVPTPSRLLAYLRGQAGPDADVGHNPLGALSVIAMLGTIALQVASGLASDDEISNAGPLARHLSGEWVNWATTYHTEVGKFLLLGLIVLHVAAIVRYRLQGNNLVRAMVTGDKVLPFAATESRDGLGQRLVAALVLCACAAAVYGLLQRLA